MRSLHRDRKRAPSPAARDDDEPPPDPEHHVTTERLKQQFEDRLAARLRRRRGQT